MDITDATPEPSAQPAEGIAAAILRVRAFLNRWAPWIITLAAGFVRFFRLSVPHVIIPLDETYYAKEAVQYLRHGVEINFAVHPPVGKWMIALGIQLFGDRPFGWRFTGALVGTLSVLLVYLIAKLLWRSKFAAIVASILVATDGLFFVQSRIAMLDIFLAFFVLLGFYLLLLDHDRVREDTRGLRWWRIASGVSFGLAAATKWSAIPVIPVMILIAYVWDVKRLKPSAMWQLRAVSISALVFLVPARLVAVKHGTLAGLALESAIAFAVTWIAVEIRQYFSKRRPATEASHVWVGEAPSDVIEEPAPPEAFPSRSTRSAIGIAATYLLLPALVYLGSYVAWFASTKRYIPPRCNTTVIVGNASKTTPFAGLKLWKCYQREIWDYHKNLKATKADGKPIHPYLSHAWSWPWIGRPVAHYFLPYHHGTTTIDAEILGLPNPMSWWPAFFVAIPLLLFFALRRDATAALILMMFAPLYLPWLITTRPLFMFYMTPALPFLALGLTHVIHRGVTRWPSLGPAVVAYLVLVCLSFAFFYPILAAWPVTENGVFGWSGKMWYGRQSFLWFKPDCLVDKIRSFCWI